MATPPYVSLDPNAPSGPTQAPDVYSASDLANVRALRDCIITGAVQGWSYSQTAATTRPVDRIWAQGVFRLWLQLTYGGTNNLPLTAKWWWSNDSGATWSQIGATTNLTWDTARMAITAADTNAGLWLLWLTAVMKSVVVDEIYAAHVAANGAAVHGLGTMSTQNANAVAITGGTLAGVGISASTMTSTNIQGATRMTPANPATLVSGAAWDWAATPTHCNMAPGGVINGMNNMQIGEIKRIMVNPGGGLTINTGGALAGFVYSQGSAFGASYNLVTCFCAASGGVLASIISW